MIGIIALREAIQSLKRHTFCISQGKFQPTPFERKHPQSRRGKGKATDYQASVVALAERFAYWSRDTEDPELTSRGEVQYAFQFQPTQETRDQLMGQLKFQKENPTARIVRGLTPEEQEKFMAALKEANKQTTGKK